MSSIKPIKNSYIHAIRREISELKEKNNEIRDIKTFARWNTRRRESNVEKSARVKNADID